MLVYKHINNAHLIIDVKIVMMGEWWEKESLIKLESPTSVLISAPSGGGKTFLTKKILIHANAMFKVPPYKIFFCYSMWQPLYDEMQSEIPNIQFYQGLPTMEELNDWGSENGHKILVLDDLMMKSANSEELVHMMCIGSHHANVSIIFLLQNVFVKGKSMRTVSLNCHYFILMASKRDSLQIQTLGRQIFPGKTKYFMDSYQKATSKPYGYLLVDINPRTDIKFQLRTNIFPGEDTIIFEPTK